MFRFLAFATAFLSVSSLLAQNVTLSGRVKDAATGEDLIGASVVIPELKTGSQTNEYGFFSLTVPPGTYEVRVLFPGLLDMADTVDLRQDLTRTYNLKTFETQAVEVKDQRSDKLNRTAMGMQSLDIATVKAIPMLFGEADLIKAVQMLPGVQTYGDAGTSFNVRGGGIDQNLILLDEAVVYNPSHLLGFFSVFNADAIKDVDLYKGGIPAKLGGRLSSALDIRMKEGNNQRYGFTGGIGILSSRLTVEGPIVKDKGSFILSGRRTYADLFLKLSSNPEINNNILYFYDANAKLNYELGPKDRVFISGYFGKDKLGLEGFFGFDWGNTTATARWNHIFSNRLFSNLSLIFTDFKYNISFSNGNNESQSGRLENSLQNYGLRYDFSYYPHPNHKVFFGATGTYDRFQPGRLVPTSDESIFTERFSREKQGFESAAYLEHEWFITSRLSARYGLRFSGFISMGSTEESLYGPEGPAAPDAQATDTVSYDNFEIIKTYWNPEPRVALSYKLMESSSIKFSYDRTAQYIHQMVNASSSLPTDQWLPSGKYIRPQLMDQLALGYFQNVWSNKLELSVEVYYKWLHNVLDFKDWAELILNDEIEKEIRRGRGRAYGIELMAQKTQGKFTGWVSYTFARVERIIPELNNGNWYYAFNDRPHYITAVATWNPIPKLTLGATFVLGSGQPITFPSGVYFINNNPIPYYTERASYRMPTYHRADVSATYVLNKRGSTKRFRHELNLSCYNVYGRKNAWAIVLEQNEDDPQQTQATKIYLFQWVPSITWNFSF